MKLSGKNINIKHLLLSTLGSCLLLFTTPGCIKENFPTDCAEQGKEVTLQMSVATRTVDENGNVLTEIDPEDYEARLKTMRIYAFTNNQLVGHFAYPNPDEITSNRNGVMNFFMHLEAHSTTLQQVDFYVIANEAGLQGATFRDEMTVTELENLTFSSIAQVTDPENMSMPNITKKSYILDMGAESTSEKPSGHEDHTLVGAIYEYNTSAAENATLAEKKGNQVDKLTFNLERPTGKLRVFAASLDNSAKLTIVRMSLTGGQAPSNAYVIPHTEAQLKARKYQTIGEVSMSLSTEATNATNGCKYFNPNNVGTPSERLDDANYTEVTSRAYYPHELPFGSEPANWMNPTKYDASGNVDANGTAKGNVLEIIYCFDGGEEMTGTVYLPPIKRNHYYAIYCLMSNTGQFTIEYTVTDWEHNNTDVWNETFQYPSYSPLYPLGATSLDQAIADNLFKNPQCWPANHDVGESASDPFEGCFAAQFLFTGPESVTVKPTLFYAGTDIVLEVWQGNDKLTLPNDEISPAKDPYIIVVRSKAPVTKKVELGISFFPIWDSDNSFLLLINQGSGDQRLWPDSGDETNKIEIECVPDGGNNV